MKCVFCAEEIQDAAIVCRFCGARKIGGEWVLADRPMPGAAAPAQGTFAVGPVAVNLAAAGLRRKGAFTIKTSAVLLMVSGLFTLMWVTSEVALFGEMRGGLVAVGYNLVFAALFTTMGIGLWVGRQWGYRLVFVGTLVYTVDKLVFLLDKPARAASMISAQATQQKQIADLLGKDMIDLIDALVMLIAGTCMLCWWGFALYIYLRRDYFRDIAVRDPSY